MAQRWVALLRGVNLGSRNRVPMPELRRLLEDEGLDDVRTYIASGNVVFSQAASDRTALARRLERLVGTSFGVSSRVVLRTSAELKKLVRAHPFDDTSKTHVVFLADKPARRDAQRVAKLDLAPDEVKVVGSDVYLHLANGVQGARLGAATLEKELGVAGTMRNWRTVAKLAELAS